MVRRHATQLELPDWMNSGVTSNSGVLPGILPLFCGDLEACNALAKEVTAKVSIQATPYHFDCSRSFLNPDWRPALAVPMHWQVSPETLDAIIRLAGLGGAGAPEGRRNRGPRWS